MTHLGEQLKIMQVLIRKPLEFMIVEVQVRVKSQILGIYPDTVGMLVARLQAQTGGYHEDKRRFFHPRLLPRQGGCFGILQS
jgi:hypothetical protein